MSQPPHLRVPSLDSPYSVADRHERPVGPGTPVECKVLATRRPRQARVNVSAERRRRPQPADPPNARVLVLLVPDGTSIPPGLEKGEWRVFVRFARR